MRLFLYFSLHSLKNQLKKLFKTWVAVFIVVCMVFGALIGLGAAAISSFVENDVEPGIEEGDNIPEPVPDDEITGGGQIDSAVYAPIAELVISGVILVIFILETVGAEQNGSIIFTQADVNLLFSSPMEPQSVLMFRIGTQIGVSLAASLYLLFQLPNLVLNLGMSLWAGLGLIFTWFMALAFGKLYHVLVYTATSSRSGAKRYIRPVMYAVIAALATVFFIYMKTTGKTPVDAALGLFNHPATRYIPVFGWLKAFAVFAIEGNLCGAIIAFAALLVSAAVLVYIIWHIKADFYEDALAKSEETAQLQQAMAEGATTVRRNKKDRSDKLRRDGMSHGSGADVFFFKTMYNRFRFAHFGFLTKTSETYLVVAVAVTLALRFIFKYENFAIVALALSACAFYRSLGNPLEQDTSMDSFRMIPESVWKKLLFSLLGGSVGCLLDILLPLIIAAVVFGEGVFTVAAWCMFILSLDFYSSSVGVFIDLSVPTSAGKTIKQIVQIMFIYFGLLPDIALIALGFVFAKLQLFMLIAAGLNVLIGTIFFSSSPACLERGR